MKKTKLHLIPRPSIVIHDDVGVPFKFDCSALPPNMPDMQNMQNMQDVSLVWAEYFIFTVSIGQSLPGGIVRKTTAEWTQKYGPLPDGFESDQGYALAVDGAGVLVAADTDAGYRHALHTLAQLLAQAEDGCLAPVKIIDWPVMHRRCAHVCYHLATDWMPESVPDFKALLRLIKLIAHFKMNFLLLEIEAMFPHQKHKKIPARDAFSSEQIREIGQVCAAWGVEIIPLLQSLGHAYHVLCHPEYAHLREVPDTTQQYCPSNPQVLPFYLELVDEIRQAFPDVKKFHIGGDESRRLGVCPECRDKVKRDGVGALYGEYIGAAARAVLERGLTPLVWTDIMEHYPDAAGVIPAGTEFVYWKYALPRNGTPVDFEPFMRRGKTWAAAGVRFGTCNHTMYRFPEAMQGISFLGAEARRAECDSFICTDWMKAIPFEFSEPGYAYAAETAWGAQRSQYTFFDDYAALICGAGESAAGKDLLKIFSLLAFPLLPYCEDAQTHAISGGMDRYDLSALTFREKMARQLSNSEKLEKHNVLSEGLENANTALNIINALRPRLIRAHRLLDLLELSACTNAHKAHLGLAIEPALRVLKYPCPDDAKIRARLLEEFDALLAEHDRLRSRTHELLKPVMFDDHLAANLDIKFSPAARDWMKYIRDSLRRGEPVHFVLGPECVPH